ncbi:DNA mismatch repair protein MutL [Artomyces pyxidatus]|uniref:DNA mismatch repair protein MutL n=1 Tax=Artomyces pyxidatus TaxID=48021 RepID=A0ACB8TB50_9AGAM|nr:DNA mismatch repair protein MutL [Artomyces pyxidatus]
MVSPIAASSKEGSPSKGDAPEPAPIRRLHESLVNRIAAGEIIHRPASALKELIENCLDAGATTIRIQIKDGGLKLLQIQDNGCGIKKADLPILAQRFTTSKLSTFSDLAHLTTYGFRGEALASISHVANLTVITKTRKDSCAWKAAYLDGELSPAHPGHAPDPKPCAGNDGTTITVENLFYNTPARLSAIRNSSEEYARILDVVTKYSVHNAGVSFSCKKAGSNTPDLSTPSSSTTHQAIRMLYGQGVAKDLLNIEVSPAAPISTKQKGKRKRKESDDLDEEEDGEDVLSNSDGEAVADETEWRAEVYFTNANYHAKKTVFLLFINHRLVESPRIKRAIEAVYTGVLPKGASPFVYLSLQLDPTTVDVNVHPTKREVHFLNEESITERIADEIQAKLARVGERVFEYQTLLTGGIAEPDTGKKSKGKEKMRDPEADSDEEHGHPTTTSAAKKKVLSQHKVRTSVADRTLDSMFPVAIPSRHGSREGVEEDDAEVGATPDTRVQHISESMCFLATIARLRERVRKAKHIQLAEILDKHTFVGVVDLQRELSLVQHSTKLYLVNHGALIEELFYQLGLRQFGDFSRLKLSPSPPLRQLIALAVDAEDTEKSKLSKSEIVDGIFDILISRRDMLFEYFSLSISAEGLVESLPLLLPKFMPNLDKLPLFLMRLGPQVNWTAEAECFDTFLHELAYFYTPGPGPLASALKRSAEDDPSDGGAERDDIGQVMAAEKWQIQHILFPAMRRYLVPPKSLLARDVVQVANVPDLYRVFERC